MLLAASAALGCDPSAQPGWVSDLLPKLDCGMDLEEIRALTNKEVLDLGRADPELGSHYIRTPFAELWFQFNEQGLEAITWSRAESSQSDRYSPQHNLCTGELIFTVNVTWPTAFVGADVYLDGKLLAENARSCPRLILSTAPHELRIVKEGYEPIFRHFQLTENDRGDQDLHLTLDDLRPSA